MLKNKPSGMSYKDWAKIEDSHSNYEHPYKGGHVHQYDPPETEAEFRRRMGITNSGASGEPPRSSDNDPV